MGYTQESKWSATCASLFIASCKGGIHLTVEMVSYKCFSSLCFVVRRLAGAWIDSTTRVSDSRDDVKGPGMFHSPCASPPFLAGPSSDRRHPFAGPSSRVFGSFPMRSDGDERPIAGSRGCASHAPQEHRSEKAGSRCGALPPRRCSFRDVAVRHGRDGFGGGETHSGTDARVCVLRSPILVRIFLFFFLSTQRVGGVCFGLGVGPSLRSTAVCAPSTPHVAVRHFQCNYFLPTVFFSDSSGCP